MTVSYKSLDESMVIALAHLRGLYPGGDLAQTSPLYQRAVVWAASRALASNQAQGRFDATRTSTAMSTDLDRLAFIYDAARKVATTADGLVVRVVVSGSGSWLVTLALSTTSGLTFNPRAGDSWTTAVNEVFFIIDSNETGYECNLPIGAELTITSPPAGMEATATVYSQEQLYVLARDIEIDSEHQDRMSAALQGKPPSPSSLKYIEWITDDDAKNNFIPTHDDPPVDAFIYPKARFDADVTAVPVLQWDGIQKRPGAGLITDVETYIDSIRPPDVDFDAVRFTEDAQPMSVTLDTDTGYGRDWGTTVGAGLTLDTGPTHTSTRAYLTTAPSTENLDIGHRILIFIGANFFPNVRTVSGVSNTVGSYYVDVAEPFVNEDDTATAPSAGRTLVSAGPISQAVIDALTGIYAIMTPGDTSPATRIPPPSQANPENITDGMISRACLDASERAFKVTIDFGTATVTVSTLAGGVLLAQILSPFRVDGWLLVRFNNLN